MTGPTAPDASVSLPRAILHVDMDAFFASVEVLDDPSLVGQPVIVGGPGERGVVASCTYEARAYGIRSAMPSVRARALCPHAVFRPGRFDRYRELSGQLRAVLRDCTPLVEPLGLDEAFLDVTGARRLLGTPADIAWRIRRRVTEDLALGCSVGVARNKLLAKLASRAAKPRAVRGGARGGPRGVAVRPGPGVVVVVAEEEDEFLQPRPVEDLWGVGPATARRLHALGVRTIGELANLPPGVLERRLGPAQGRRLEELARGQDDRPVVPDAPLKSIGHEQTFPHDLHEVAELQVQAQRMAEAVAAQLRRRGLVGRTVTVKVRFASFITITRSETIERGIDSAPAVAALAAALLEGVAVEDGVRLLGVSVSGLAQAAGAAGGAAQLRFPMDGDDGGRSSRDARGEGDRLPAGDGAVDHEQAWMELSAAVDRVRARYGRDALRRASEGTGLGVPPPGHGRPTAPS